MTSRQYIKKDRYMIGGIVNVHGQVCEGAEMNIVVIFKTKALKNKKPQTLNNHNNQKMQDR